MAIKIQDLENQHKAYSEQREDLSELTPLSDEEQRGVVGGQNFPRTNGTRNNTIMTRLGKANKALYRFLIDDKPNRRSKFDKIM